MKARKPEISAPQLAWATAKAAFETAHEMNFAEQRKATAAATVDDPEPGDYTHDGWSAWYERNRDTPATWKSF